MERDVGGGSAELRGAVDRYAAVENGSVVGDDEGRTEVGDARREDVLDAVRGGGGVGDADALAGEHVRAVGGVRGHVEEDTVARSEAVRVAELLRGGGDGA